MGMQTVRMKDGIRIIDADKDFTFNITAEDILKGKPLDDERCAGAVACMRQFPGAVRASFNKTRAYVLHRIGTTEDMIWLKYMVPPKMKLLEAMNDVVMKDMEVAQQYAMEGVVLKAPKGSRRTTGKQQGSDTRPPKPPKKGTVRMRSNVSMRGTAA